MQTPPVTAVAIEARTDGLRLILSDRQVLVPWEKCSEALPKASLHERQKAELSPGGYGIHWPLLDEDLSVPGLLREALPDRI